MYNILTLNKISETGLCRFSNEYNCATDVANPDAILVRSASMHDMEFEENTLAVDILTQIGKKAFVFCENLIGIDRQLLFTQYNLSSLSTSLIYLLNSLNWLSTICCCV